MAETNKKEATNSDCPQNVENVATDISDQVKAHIRQDVDQLDEFKAAHERLRERINSTRADIVRLHAQVSENRRDFDSDLDHLRRQVAPLVSPSCSAARSPSAPPSTPAG